MQYILTSRGIDFDAYAMYLVSVRDRLPPLVASFAGDHRHHSLNDRETLHDAWLESLVLREEASGERREIRRTAIEIHLLGAFHDRTHVLRYGAVRRYELSGRAVGRGHGDLYAHEVRLGRDGTSIVHELVFGEHAADSGGSRILIECADFTHQMVADGRSAD